MLRNLNRSASRGRILGTPNAGVLGLAIPASGAHGPGYAYNDLSLPADAGKDICGRVTTMPATGTLFAYEDTSFDYTPAGDGAASFQYQLYVDGVAVGSPTTVTLASGAGGTTINATPGDAVANGSLANIVRSTTVNAAAGDAAAAGLTAGITTSNGTSISCDVGGAAAAGALAGIILKQTINCTPGDAVADGLTCFNFVGVGISCAVGAASAGGLLASIVTTTGIQCGIGNAVAAGLQSQIASGVFHRSPKRTLRVEPENRILKVIL